MGNSDSGPICPVMSSCCLICWQPSLLEAFFPIGAFSVPCGSPTQKKPETPLGLLASACVRCNWGRCLHDLRGWVSALVATSAFCHLHSSDVEHVQVTKSTHRYIRSRLIAVWHENQSWGPLASLFARSAVRNGTLCVLIFGFASFGSTCSL